MPGPSLKWRLQIGELYQIAFGAHSVYCEHNLNYNVKPKPKLITMPCFHVFLDLFYRLYAHLRLVFTSYGVVSGVVRALIT